MTKKYNNWRFLITSSCNSNCFFCHRDGTHENGYFLDFVLFEETINKFKKDINKIRFAGGEPFLHPDIFKMIKRTLPLTEDLGIVTNGLLLSKYSKKIKEINLPKLTISLHTLNAQSFEKITGLDKKIHKQIIDSIIDLKNHVKKIKINSVVLKDINTNNEEIETLINFIIKHNLDMEFIELDLGSLKKIDFQQYHFPPEKLKNKVEKIIKSKMKYNSEECNWICYVNNSKIEIHKSLCVNKLCNECVRNRPILMYPNGTINRCRLNKPVIRNIDISL
jgi:GTP 3',8-cyclase